MLKHRSTNQFCTKTFRRTIKISNSKNWLGFCLQRVLLKNYSNAQFLCLLFSYTAIPTANIFFRYASQYKLSLYNWAIQYSTAPHSRNYPQLAVTKHFKKGQLLRTEEVFNFIPYDIWPNTILRIHYNIGLCAYIFFSYVCFWITLYIIHFLVTYSCLCFPCLQEIRSLWFRIIFLSRKKIIKIT